MSARHAEEAAVIVAVVFGLEADEVVVGERADTLLLSRNREQQVGRRTGNVKEEADRIVEAPRPQLARQGDQVIVVDPDHVVGLEQLRQMVREERVDPQVAREVRSAELGEVDAVVEDRPEHTVGETGVVFLVVRGRQRRHDIGDVVADDRRGLDIGIVLDLAAPAEPKTRPRFQRGMDRDRQAARRRRMAGLRDGDAVRDDNQSAHQRSSQLWDKRMAELMIPAME